MHKQKPPHSEMSAAVFCLDVRLENNVIPRAAIATARCVIQPRFIGILAA